MTKDELLRLAADILSCLRDLPTRALKLTSAPRSGEAETGLYCTLATLSPGNYFCLYLDASADHNERGHRHLWYGFDCEERKDGDRLKKAAALALGETVHAREDFNQSLEEHQFGQLLWEPVRGDGYYVGRYVGSPALGRARKADLAREIALFAQCVVATSRFGAEQSTLAQRILREVWTRQGQGPFRRQLMDDFGAACCLSGCTIEGLLEAAHICTHDKSDDHSRGNGLLLRADLHTLFDLDMLRIHPDTFEVEMDEQVARSRDYGCFHERCLAIPEVLRAEVSMALRRRDEWRRNPGRHSNSRGERGGPNYGRRLNP